MVGIVCLVSGFWFLLYAWAVFLLRVLLGSSAAVASRARATIAVRSLRSGRSLRHPRCRLPAAAFGFPRRIDAPRTRALATPGSRVEVPIRCWGEGAWRVLRGWFSLEDLARTRKYGARAALFTHRVSHYETRLFWLAVPGVKGFFRCLGTILPEWSRPGCRCARKGSLLPIKRATVSASKGSATGVRFQCAVANQPRNRLYAESGALQLMQPGKTYAAVFGFAFDGPAVCSQGMLLGGHESFL